MSAPRLVLESSYSFMQSATTKVKQGANHTSQITHERRQQNTAGSLSIRCVDCDRMARH
jgi:hypothetical protein